MFTKNRSVRQRMQEASEVHRSNIRKSLQHRLEVARVQGNENLISQLEAEVNYYN